VNVSVGVLQSYSRLKKNSNNSNESIFIISSLKYFKLFSYSLVIWLSLSVIISYRYLQHYLLTLQTQLTKTFCFH